MTRQMTRQDRLFRELRAAISNTKPDELKVWGRNSAERLPRIAVRRVKNLGTLLSALAKFTGKELMDALRALGAGRLWVHLEGRAVDGIDGAIDIAKRIEHTAVAGGRALFDDPKKNALGVLALALGFLVGSGGTDGNGGVPDTDLALGIDAHRSLLTHSIFAGTLVEGAILALADLADVVCEKLPGSERDPFWDKLMEAKNNIAQQLASGASAGIAYHLAVDATLQPGAYHGLPVSMPMEAHQTLLALNAVAEGLDTVHKEKTTGRQVVDGVKTAGEAVKKGVASGVKDVWEFGSRFISGLRGDGKK